MPVSLDLTWDHDEGIYLVFKKKTMISDCDFLDPKEMTMYINITHNHIKIQISMTTRLGSSW